MNRRRQSPAPAVSTAGSKMEQLLETPEGMWRSARLLASVSVGTLAPCITALIPKFFDAREGIDAGITTMGVDQHYRVYVNNGFTSYLAKAAQEVSPTNPCHCGATSHHPLAYIAGVIIHESQHPMREHSKRAKEIMADWKLFNVASDMEINDDLLVIFKEAFSWYQSHGMSYPLLCLPSNGMYPKTFREKYPESEFGVAFPDDRLAEEYYYKIRTLQQNLPSEQQGQDQQGQGQGQGQQGQGSKSAKDLTDEELEEIFKGSGDLLENNGQDCGSGAHGESKDYEEGDPTPEQPGISDAENDAIKREVAKAIEKEHAMRGNYPAGMRAWAEKVLTPPKHDWRKEFAQKVRKAVQRAWGHEQRTWRSLGRRSAAQGYKFLYPSYFTPVPKIGIVLDTSGSMGGGSLGSPLQIACSEVQGICKAVGARVSFLSVDCKASVVTEVGSFDEAFKNMQGGGGTDMRVGIEAMEDMPEPPQVCIVLTDGETPWPDNKPRGGMEVIAGLVGSGAKRAAEYVPSWMTKVIIEDKEA